MGYEKVLQVSELGEFSQRGGTIDLFPIHSKNAIRFEFLGNKIENIELLDKKVENEKIARKILQKRKMWSLYYKDSFFHFMHLKLLQTM